MVGRLQGEEAASRFLCILVRSCNTAGRGELKRRSEEGGGSECSCCALDAGATFLQPACAAFNLPLALGGEDGVDALLGARIFARAR